MAEPRHGSLAVTKEPSGEIRVALGLPNRSKEGRRKATERQAYGAGCAALVYSKKSGESSCQSPGRGLLPKRSVFSSRGKRAVKNACGALERTFGKRIVFGTLTLAGSTDAARMALAQWSSVVIELLNKWRKYHAPNSLWVTKWEWQRSGALHLHFAIGDTSATALRSLEQRFKKYVYSLHSHLSELSGCDVFARGEGGTWVNFPGVLRSRIEPVRKSVKRYMAKYMSKGNGSREGFSPSRWWGQSRKLKALVDSYRECKVLRSENWNHLCSKYDRIAEGIALAKVTAFHVVSPFGGSGRKLLVYANDDDVEAQFLAICSLVSDGINLKDEGVFPHARMIRG